MRRVYLVRHATPAIQPEVPSRDWGLSETGIAQARSLAEVAGAWQLAALYSSSENKARSTASIIGDGVGLPVHVVDGFEELKFDAWIGNADEFSETVRSILENPALSVRGAERADAAAARFALGVAIVSKGPFPAAIVSHGRILTAYLAHTLGMEYPYDVWRSIPTPGYASIDLDAAKPRLLHPFCSVERDKS